MSLDQLVGAPPITFSQFMIFLKIGLFYDGDLGMPAHYWIIRALVQP